MSQQQAYFEILYKVIQVSGKTRLSVLEYQIVQLRCIYIFPLTFISLTL